MNFQNYKQRIIHQTRGILIGLYMIDEHSGVVASDSSPQGNDGGYNGPTLNNATGPDGRGVPFFDGTNDYVNLYSSGILDDLDLDEYSCIQWLKVYNAGVWTDGVGRPSLTLFWSTPDVNGTTFARDSNNNEVEIKIERRAGGETPQAHNFGGLSTLEWFSIGTSVSVSGGYVKYYLDGVLAATDAAPSAATATVNNAGRIGGYGAHWYGWIGPTVVTNAPLSDAQQAILGRQ